MDAHTHPRLLADIGSRYARFALEGPAGQLERAAQLRCEDYPDFISALRAYLTQVRDVSVRHGAVAIANPVEGDQVRMTNYHWQFSIEETRVQAGLDTLVVVNDFTALAVAVSHVDEHQRRQVGGGHPRSQSVM
ncbi:MAG: bifunctional transcriptional regulator/glucokinase, partial [Burkholderiaceae bacterium]